jgi:hypothetical protein
MAVDLLDSGFSIHMLIKIIGYVYTYELLIVFSTYVGGFLYILF